MEHSNLHSLTFWCTSRYGSFAFAFLNNSRQVICLGLWSLHSSFRSRRIDVQRGDTRYAANSERLNAPSSKWFHDLKIHQTTATWSFYGHVPTASWGPNEGPPYIIPILSQKVQGAPKIRTALSLRLARTKIPANPRRKKSTESAQKVSVTRGWKYYICCLGGWRLSAQWGPN